MSAVKYSLHLLLNFVSPSAFFLLVTASLIAAKLPSAVSMSGFRNTAAALHGLHPALTHRSASRNCCCHPRCVSLRCTKPHSLYGRRLFLHFSLSSRKTRRKLEELHPHLRFHTPGQNPESTLFTLPPATEMGRYRKHMGGRDCKQSVWERTTNDRVQRDSQTPAMKVLAAHEKLCLDNREARCRQ